MTISRSPARASTPSGRRVAATPSPPGGPGGEGSIRALALPLAAGLALLAVGLLVPRRQLPELFAAFVGAGGGVLLWTGVLLFRARATGRAPVLRVAVHRHHWVQAFAQLTVLLWWGWHVSFVYPYFALVGAQLVFAYAVDSLLSWTRRGTYAVGFGPFPVIFSINLFLWFRPEWFFLQFAMVAVAFLGKEFLRWDRDGKSTHIFNPSAFPLAVFSVVLLATGTAGELTLGREIASSQYSVPLIYLVIFLAALPGQLLFGVARMTMAGVTAMYLLSLGFLVASGTYLFYDAYIPVPVFLGMHLLFTDPATSPRTTSGRLLFGAVYAASIAGSFLVLEALELPTYFDKLLPLPFLNLLARRIDRLAAGGWMHRMDAARVGAALTQGQRHVVYTSAWAAVFVALYAVQGIGDRHPGQALPLWQRACEAGSARACEYTEYRTSVYCGRGSGWACNEWGARQVAAGRSPGSAFRRGCELGFGPACANARRTAGDAAPLARSTPSARDLPVVLSWKRPTEERDPARLLAMGCSQGWAEMCGR